MTITSVLFDLDGTLVDTAPDLALALNMLLVRHGKSALPLNKIRPVASHGSLGLLKLGFDITPRDVDFTAKRDEYLSLYDEVFTRSPTLFLGVNDLLVALEKNCFNWGVVTNKPRRFTQPLMQAIEMHERAACIVSGDDAAQPKPSPEPLLMACQTMKVKPEQCLYIGDAERDIIAGKAAGMKTLVALWGYLATSDEPEKWGADAMITHPKDVLDFLV